MAFFQLGRAYHSLGKHDKSLSHFREYYKMCQEAGDKVGEGNACYALADAHEAAGDIAGSFTYFSPSLSEFPAILT